MAHLEFQVKRIKKDKKNISRMMKTVPNFFSKLFILSLIIKDIKGAILNIFNVDFFVALNFTSSSLFCYYIILFCKSA